MNRHNSIRFGLAGGVVGALLIASSLSAHPPRDGNQPPRHGNHPPAVPDSSGIAQMVDELTDALSLTSEQKTAISTLHFEHFAEVATVIETPPKDRESHREAMEALRTDLYERVAALLTDGQRAKYEELAADREPPRRPQRPRRD